MSEENGLPAGWAWTTLQDCATRITDGTHQPPQFVEAGIPFIFVRNIVGGYISFDETKFVSEATYQELNRRCPVERGDILYSAVGSYGVAVPVKTDLPFSFQRHIAHLKPIRDLDQSYLVHYLNSPSAVRRAHEVARGVAQKTVTLGDLVRFPVPLAPLAEQRRIVAAIEAQFTRLDAGVAALRRAQTALKRYRAAVLRAAVEGRLTEAWRAEHPDTEPASDLLARILTERRARWEADLRAKGKDPAKARYVEPAAPDVASLPTLPDSWCWATVEQISDESRAVTYGVVKLGEIVEGGVPTLRSSNVRNLHIELDGLKSISPAIANQYKRTFLQGNEVLVTVRGTLGGVVVVPTELAGYNISREVAMIALINPALAPCVATFIASPQVQSWIQANTKGIAYTGINIETLKELPLPLPPLAEQEAIVAEVERRLSVVGELEAAVAANLKRAERLRQAILREAFAGHLVSRDLNDEPASALLERIRQAREKQQPREPKAEHVRVAQAGLWAPEA